MNPVYADPAHLGQLADFLERHGVAVLPQLLDPATLAFLQAEVRRLRPLARQRDFVMPGWNTPRRLATLGAAALGRAASVLPDLGAEASVLRMVRAVTRDPAARPADHQHERAALNLQEAGGTHGWHLDDPPWALAILLEEPEAGGALELAPGWTGGITDASGVVGLKAVALRAGDGYLLRADRTLHRVAEVERGQRAALSLAFQGAEPVVYGGTSDALHAGEV